MDGSAAILLRRGPHLASGGEADVYRVSGRPDLLLKVFREEPSAAARLRIGRLIAKRSPALDRVAAWPQRWLLSDGQSALVLPFVSRAQPVHMLFDRRTWRDTFPEANWAFMIQVAQAVAKAVAAVHAAGLAVVDISEKNVLVREDGSVMLIDCDSFVIMGQGSQSVSDLFTVGWVAPELAPVLNSTPRTANHDNFSLARMVFQLLFAGRSPLEPPPGCSPEQSERVFGYSHANRVRADDPADVSLADVSPIVASYFEQAFARPGGGRVIRPAAAQWVEALGEMLGCLGTCKRVRSHRFLGGHGRACPWCRIATAPNGSDPFRQVAAPSPPQPAPVAPVLAPPKVQPKPPKKRNGVASLAVMAAVVIGAVVWGQKPENTPQSTPAAAGLQRLPIQPRTSFSTVTGATPTVQQYAIEFAMELSAAFGDPNASEILDRAYAAEVQYFDKGIWPHWRIMHQKNHIISKWPVRSYVPRPGSASVQCDPSGVRCTVSLLTDWHNSNAQRSKSGTWSSTVVLDMSGLMPLVISEDGGKADGEN